VCACVRVYNGVFWGCVCGVSVSLRVHVLHVCIGGHAHRQPTNCEHVRV